MLLTAEGEVHVTLVSHGSWNPAMRTALSDCRLLEELIDCPCEIRLPIVGEKLSDHAPPEPVSSDGTGDQVN